MRTEIFDSTLRDGSQAEGISFSIQDKLNIVKALDSFGVDYIEAGNPASNPKEQLFFEKLRDFPLKNSKICAFGSTVRYGTRPENDAGLAALIGAGTEVVSVFGKAWDLHVTEILRISLENNLEIVESTVKYLKSLGKELIFDAEHFFDGYKNNREYALSVLKTAVSAGADCICLCDTNGGMLPLGIAEIVKDVCQSFPGVRIGIHCHDDTGCAAANTVTAVVSGACHIQGTFNGFGERCGNANLSAIIPDLELKCGIDCGVKLKELKATARSIAEISNIHLPKNAPYVGKSAFSHKGGMHIDGVLKLPRSFEHIDPETVGNERRFLLSEVSGRGTVLPKIQKYAPEITKQSEKTALITEKLKEREMYGYQYEAAEASFELFVKKALGMWNSHFNMVMYKVTDDFPAPDGEQQSNAIVKIEVDGKTQMSCDCGNGPVNALDKALRNALTVFYPQLAAMHLIDYKVRVIDSKSTDAVTRVLIESSDGEASYTTIGVSSDIIEASVTALVDSYEYVLSGK